MDLPEGRQRTEDIKALLEQIHCWLPALIADEPDYFDHVNMRAKVLIKDKRIYGRDMPDQQEEVGPLVLWVPVLHGKTKTFLDRIPYERGDPVFVGFADRALDYIIKDLRQQDPYFHRAHHINDAIVVRGFMVDKGEPRAPSAYRDDWIVVHNRKTGENLRMSPDGTVHSYTHMTLLGLAPHRPDSAIGDLTICLCTGCPTMIITGSPHVKVT